jgi:hypothetical protein
MSRSLRIRKPQAADIRQLHHVFEGALSPRPRRRAEAILLYAAGLTAGDIANVLDVHVNTIYADLHAFGTHGVAAVHHCSRGERPSGSPRRSSLRYGGWRTFLRMSWVCPTAAGP